MGKAPGTRGQGCVATFMLGSSWVSSAVTVKRGVAYFTYFRIEEYL